MKRWKKAVLVVIALLLTGIGGCVVIVGPWPTYTAGYENETFYTDALAAIDASAQSSEVTTTPGRLHAGWGTATITPPVGTPLAGFGARRGAPSTRIHDEIFVKALVVSDGADVAAIVGSDMLLVPNNVADLVREAVGRETPLKPDTILFNASHSHSGPGAWAPGYVAKTSGGAYNPEIVTLLSERFTEAILAAHRNLEPAAIARGAVDAPQFIRNRTRRAPVDSLLHYLVVRQDDGDTLYVTRYSAHPTVVGSDSMAVTGEFPGFMQRALEAATGATALYLGGAVGSMGPQAPDGPDDFTRAEAMGNGLAELVLEATQELEFNEHVDIASAGASFETPSFQLRINRSWRVSPFFPALAGVDNEAWMGAVRIGDVVMVGVPADFSGEISRDWQAWGRALGVDLWALSFNADYVGYISPDRYYGDVDEKGRLDYETGLMSWMGPQQEAFTTALMRRMVQGIVPQGGGRASGRLLQTVSAP